MRMSVLTLHNYSVSYVNTGRSRKVHAVKNIDLKLETGDALGIVGESGSGKSTLAMAILGLLSEKTTEISGSAEFEGQELVGIDASELDKLRWTKLAVVFQKAMNSLSPVHRIRTQVEDIYRVKKPDAGKKEIADRFQYLLSLVNLPPRVYGLYPHELSGGMVQRVNIAISLLHSPSLLILDESTTALDVVTQGQILDEIVKMQEQFEMSRIMITHDISVVSASCNKIAVLYAGELMETGSVRSILKHPRHPYTKGLIDAIPELQGEKTALKGIPGNLPDLSELHQGCIFADRCPNVMDICRTSKPEQVSLAEDHLISCHLFGKHAEAPAGEGAEL